MAARRRLTIKRLDPWSVLKFGFLANLCLLAIGLLGAVVVWFFVNRLDLIGKACGIAESVGFEDCGVDGGNLFRAVLLLGLLGAIIQTGVLVFMSFLHNLIADLVGGLQISVIDEAASTAAEASRRAPATRSRPAPIGADRTRAQPAARPPETAGADDDPTPHRPPEQTPSRAPAPVPRESAGTSGSSGSASSGSSRSSDGGGDSMFGGREAGRSSPIRQAGRPDDDRDEGGEPRGDGGR